MIIGSLTGKPFLTYFWAKWLGENDSQFKFGCSLKVRQDVKKQLIMWIGYVVAVHTPLLWMFDDHCQSDTAKLDTSC